MNSARNSLILCLLFPHLLRTPIRSPPAATKVVPPDLEGYFQASMAPWSCTS